MPWTLLLSLAALGAGCSAPESRGALGAGELAGTGTTEAAADDDIGDADDADDDAEASGGAATGGQESGGQESGGQESGGQDTTTGDDENETDGTDTEGESGSDGIVCDERLGTEEHCLDCDDACGDGESCTAQGCAAPVDIGFSEPFAGIGGYPGRLWGFAVQVEQDSVLSALNFHAVGNGGDVQLALYGDDAGVPSELLAMTDVVEDYGPGPQSLATDPVALAAGTYWVMARNDFPSQIGLDYDPDILPPFALTSVFIEFDEPLPEQLAGTDTFNSYPINLWITVLEP